MQSPKLNSRTSSNRQLPPPTKDIFSSQLPIGLLRATIRVALLTLDGGHLPAASQTVLTGHALAPRVAKNFDPVALVVGVVACKVTVGLEAKRRVVAEKEEFFPVTHVGLLSVGGFKVVVSRSSEPKGS